MEQQEQQSSGEQYSGDASESASSSEVQEEGGNFEESPPLPFPHHPFPQPSYPQPPFPQRNLEYTVNSSQSELLTATENEGSPVIRNYWSGVNVVLTFWFFAAMTLIFGVYAPEDVRLGPNSSILINPNHLFVESIKVVELNTGKGLMLYGFYKNPPLDVMISWSDSHKITLPASTHKEWNCFLNEGSQINISYSMNSQHSSSLVLVIAEGNEGLDAWLENPSYPNTTLSWNIIHGNGSVQKEVSKSSSYYIAVGNLNSEAVEVHLKIRIKALLYNTTRAYYQCALVQGQCSFKLCFLSECAALLTSPGQKSVVANGDWSVKISYEPRWITYIVGTGGMTVLVLLINHILNRFQSTDQDRRRDRVGVMGSERNPLLSQKDDDLSSWGSSDVSVSEEEEYLEDVQAGGVRDGKPVKDGEYSNSIRRLCAICFDAPRDCFFLPCGHCVACFGCATRIAEASGTCPICRRHTKKVRKLYTV